MLGEIYAKTSIYRYNVEGMDHEERNSIYIPELQMTWSAWSALRKSWQGFYAARRTGDSESIDRLLERITMIRKYMGLEDEGTYY